MPKLRYNKNNFLLTMPKHLVTALNWEKGENLYVTYDRDNHCLMISNKLIKAKENIQLPSSDPPIEKKVPPLVNLEIPKKDSPSPIEEHWARKIWPDFK